MKEIMAKVYEEKVFHIKECPFCSSENVEIGVNRKEEYSSGQHQREESNKYFNERYFIKCLSCDARSPIHTDCNQSVSEWNSTTCSIDLKPPDIEVLSDLYNNHIKEN